MIGLTPVDYTLATLVGIAVAIMLCSACIWLIKRTPDPGRRAARPRPEKPLRPEDADTVMFVRAAGSDVLADYARDTDWLRLPDVPRPVTGRREGRALHGLNHARAGRDTRVRTGATAPGWPGAHLSGSPLSPAQDRRRDGMGAQGEPATGHAVANTVPPRPDVPRPVDEGPQAPETSPPGAGRVTAVGPGHHALRPSEDVPGQEASGKGPDITAGRQHHGPPHASSEGEAGSPGRAPRRDPDAPFGRDDQGQPVVKYGLRRDGRPRQTPLRARKDVPRPDAAARPRADWRTHSPVAVEPGAAGPGHPIRRITAAITARIGRARARLMAFLRIGRPARFWSAQSMTECARTAALIAYAESILPGGAG